MKTHDDLIKEAEELAAGMKQGEKINQGFIHSYVANHELQLVIQAIEHLRDKVNWIWNFVMATAIAIGVGLIGLIVFALAKWIMG